MLRYVIILTLFQLSVSVTAQSFPAVSSGDIEFYLDYSAFMGDDNKTYTEFYLMLFTDQIKLSEETGLINITASLKDSENNIAHKLDRDSDILISGEMKSDDFTAIYDGWNGLIPPGNYTLDVKITDKYSNKTGGLSTAVNIPDYSSGGISLSHLEFVSKTEPENPNVIFKKGSRFIIPNPWRRYGILVPTLKIYYELYNINARDSLSAVYSMIDSENKKVKTLPPVAIGIDKENISLLHGIDVSNLTTGRYTVSVDILNRQEETVAKTERSFEVFQADYFAVPDILIVEKITALENLLTFTATPSQLSAYNDLNKTGKLNYLSAFWDRQDKSPETEENEYLADLLKRYNYAQEKFTWDKKQGWKSERGRVLIQYGMPDQIEYHHSEPNTIPYEVWLYSLDREYYFIFADLYQDGRFALLHSNKEGEIYNSTWREQVKK